MRTVAVYGEDGPWLGDLAGLVERSLILLDDRPRVCRANETVTMTSGFAIRTDDLWRVAAGRLLSVTEP